MKTKHCSAITLFRIVNGIVFGGEKYPTLVEWCKKHGYVTDKPIDMPMWAGTKSLIINNDDTYTVIYKIDLEKLGINKLKNQEYTFKLMRKLCLGIIKKYSKDTINCNGAISLKHSIINYEFDEDNLSLKITLDKDNVSKESFISLIKKLDLEIYYLFNTNFDWFEHLDALMQCARDTGQPHWINESWHNLNTNIDPNDD